MSKERDIDFEFVAGGTSASLTCQNVTHFSVRLRHILQALEPEAWSCELKHFRWSFVISRISRTGELFHARGMLKVKLVLVVSRRTDPCRFQDLFFALIISIRPSMPVPSRPWIWNWLKRISQDIWIFNNYRSRYCSSHRCTVIVLYWLNRFKIMRTYWSLVLNVVFASYLTLV